MSNIRMPRSQTMGSPSAGAPRVGAAAPSVGRGAPVLVPSETVSSAVELSPSAPTPSQSAVPVSPALEQLRSAWMGQWEAALALWSPFTRLSPPELHLSHQAARKAGMDEAFACIFLHNHSVHINLAMIQQQGLEAFALEILAHEIGHHILTPGDLNDNARLLALMRLGLPTLELHAPMISNLYEDLLINDRLQRHSRLLLADVWQRIQAPKTESSGQLWLLYMRIYEHLWGLAKGSLARGPLSEVLETDAWLGARLIRVYANQWLEGAGSFAVLCLPYLMKDVKEELISPARLVLDTLSAGESGMPAGLTELTELERMGLRHPSRDPAVNDQLVQAQEDTSNPRKPFPQKARQPSPGNHREPFEYGALLRALGLPLDDHEAAVHYYRERASRHLIPYPTRRMPQQAEPHPEGLSAWEVGDPLEHLDWVASTLYSPYLIPGVSTLQRLEGMAPGAEPERGPIDLDLFVDCSGSMPNPQLTLSYLALGGAIIAMSALRAGARVRATLWSGPGEFQTTSDFVRDEQAILRILTGYLGGSTAFPLHLLRDTYVEGPRRSRSVQLLIISDEGVDTLFGLDEKGRAGRDISARALQSAGGGGTMLLNISPRWRDRGFRAEAEGHGWRIWPTTSWEELVVMARAFSRQHYVRESKQ